MYSSVITKAQWEQAQKYRSDTPNFGEALFWAKYPGFYEAEMKRRKEAEIAKAYEAEMKRRKEAEIAKAAEAEKPITGKQKKIF